MKQPICLEICTNCGMQDAHVTGALQRLQERYGENLTLEVAPCLFSCNLPAVVVGGRQVLVRSADTSRLEELVAGQIKAAE